MPKGLRIDPRDNVAVVLADVQKGEEITVDTEKGALCLKAAGSIPFGHKIALLPFAVDQPIIKYGEEIGKAKISIQPGDWVHLQNVYCERGRD